MLLSEKQNIQPIESLSRGHVMSYVVAIGPSSFSEQDQSPLNLLKSYKITVKPNPYNRRLTEEEIRLHLQDVDGLIAGLEPLSRRVFLSAPKLKSIARVGIGMDNIDLDAAKELSIKVSNTPDGPTQAVAEMVIGAMLTLCRQIIVSNAALHKKKWNKNIGQSLAGSKILLVGYGRIGRRVGDLLRAFEAKVLVTDPYLSNNDLKFEEQLVPLDEGLREAEIVSLHASGKDIILGAAEFNKMQHGTILLNAARGELVDENALIEALKSGKVSSAWFDVFWKEPYYGRLLDFDQVLLTPHISTYTRQCRLKMEMEAVKNLLRDLDITS